MRARRLVHLLGLVFVFAGLTAQAAWLESGAPAATPVPWIPPHPTPYPYVTPTPRYPHYPTDSHARVVRDFLSGASLGSAYGWGGLTIVPVLATTGGGGSSIRTLESALRSGTLTVREYGAGSVPTIEVENRGSSAVFLLAGEIILGGKQDRIIRQDTVIGPHSGPVQVPVYCVEQGRWASSARSFEAAPHAIADRDLRAKASAGAGQDEIWSHVTEKSEAAGVRSSTSSYGDVVASPEMSRRLDEYVTRCPRPTVWRGRAVGAVFMSGGEVLGVDLFGDPALMSALWPKLVRSYAAQAVGYRPHTRYDDDERHYLPPHTGGASAALEALRSAWPSFSGWAGSAPRLNLSVSGYDAWAIPWDGEVVHVAALPGARYYEPPPPPPPPYPWYREE